jgi:aspartate-semialdehyde dehydrogenase
MEDELAEPRIALVGATGAVGDIFLQVLDERRFPVGSLRLCASPRSVGKRLSFRGQELPVELASKDLFAECDIAFISVTADVSRELIPLAVEAGCVAIDDSSAYRMDPDVPLVVPEVNAEDVDGHKGILAIPNCSTTPIVMALQPLRQVNPIVRVLVDTYQSVSGTGKAAVQELREQSQQVLAGQSVHPKQYPHQIAFNVLPHIEPFLENGYTREEQKVLQETRKIMHAPEMAISATCVRVPVPVGHSAALHVEFQRPMDVAEARKLLAAFPGVTVVDDPANSAYPMPINAAGKDDVFVGRIRQDASHPNGLAMWVVSDNLRKGAATNAVQIAEELVARGALARQGAA